jgi:hypothetical protein
MVMKVFWDVKGKDKDFGNYIFKGNEWFFGLGFVK